jgi:hypothetical protein
MTESNCLKCGGLIGEPMKMSLDKEPDFVFENVNYEKQAVAFPDAGCC